MDGLPGHDPAPRPAAARVPAAAEAGGRRDRRWRRRDPRAPRGEPDARPPRLPAGLTLPRDLRDAGAGDRPGALAVAERTGEAPLVEIMLPLVGVAEELRRLRRARRSTPPPRSWSRREALEYHVGTMIELPRAALRADEIAAEADFFSFGTNDLTQTTLGFSRDDAEGKFLTRYLEDRILADEPVRDARPSGVGELMRIAVERGRGVDAGHQARHLRRARRRPASRSRSATSSGSTTSPARRSASRSRASPRPRRRWPSAASPPVQVGG